MRNKLNILAFILAVVIALSYFLFFKNSSDKISEQTDINLFKTVLDLTRKEYVDLISPGEKIPVMHSTFLKNLDPASSYLNAQKSLTFQELQNPVFLPSTGIFGIKINDHFLVTDVINKSPAYKAKIEPEDRILSINNQNFQFFSFWQIFLSLHSTKPASIKFTILKKNGTISRNISIKTRVIMDQESNNQLQKNIYYFSIKRHNQLTLLKLSKLLNKNAIQTLILDLRQYISGTFNDFKNIADLILPGQITVKVKSKTNEEYLKFGTQNKTKCRIITIINQSTIMYNEFLAYLLRYSKVKIVGQKSGGILARLKPVKFPDNSTALISSGYYYLNQKKISNTPILPDIKINLREKKNILKKLENIINHDQ